MPKNKLSSKSSPAKVTKNLKLGVVIDRLNVGGVEKIAIEEVTALRKQGYDATLVVLRKKAVVENAFPDLLKGVPIEFLDQRLPKLFRFSFGFPVFKFFSWFHISYAFLLPFVVKKHEYDYFIVHGTYTSITAVMLKKIRKIHFSAFIWDPVSYILERVYAGSFLGPVLWVLKKIAYLLDGFLIRNMDNVLVGGDAHNSFIHRIAPGKPIEVVYPSVHPIKKPLKKSDYVMIVTAWKEGKDPEYLFKIVQKLPDIKIKMVGKWLDPAYLAGFKKKLKAAGYSQQIDIVGAVSEKQLQEHYAKALVLLQTNDDRGFGMPALEAAGNATTFIIPKDQGVGALFADGEGFYTKEKDTAAITKQLSALLKDKKQAAKRGERGWKKVTANYSWDNHAKQLVTIVTKSLVTDHK